MEHLDADYNSDIDNGDWAMADLKSASIHASIGRLREIHESFCGIQQAEALQNLLELMSRLAEKPIFTSSTETTSSLEHLEAQHNVLCDEAERSWERVYACEKKSATDLSTVEAKAANLKTSLNASAACVCC